MYLTISTLITLIAYTALLPNPTHALARAGRGRFRDFIFYEPLGEWKIKNVSGPENGRAFLSTFFFFFFYLFSFYFFFFLKAVNFFFFFLFLCFFLVFLFSLSFWGFIMCMDGMTHKNRPSHINKKMRRVSQPSAPQLTLKI